MENDKIENSVLALWKLQGSSVSSSAGMLKQRKQI